MDSNFSKLDPESRLQLRLVEAETKLEQYQTSFDVVSAALSDFGKRIETLEEARKKQIELNKGFLTYGDKLQERLDKKSEGEPIIIRKPLIENKAWWKF